MELIVSDDKVLSHRPYFYSTLQQMFTNAEVIVRNTNNSNSEEKIGLFYTFERRRLF